MTAAGTTAQDAQQALSSRTSLMEVQLGHASAALKLSGRSSVGSSGALSKLAGCFFYTLALNMPFNYSRLNGKFSVLAVHVELGSALTLAAILWK